MHVYMLGAWSILGEDLATLTNRLLLIVYWAGGE